MADPEHVEILEQGVEVWNRWREKHPAIKPDLNKVSLTELDVDLSYADLSYTDLSSAFLYEAQLEGADLSHANLRSAFLEKARLADANFSHSQLHETWLKEAKLDGAVFLKANLYQTDLENADLYYTDFQEAYLSQVNLSDAILEGANFYKARILNSNLFRAIFSEADLREVDLSESNLKGTIFHNVNLRGANLTSTSMVRTDFTGANLRGCRVYGISAWNIDLSSAKQTDLIITPFWEQEVTVDNLEVAQFIYLLLNNQKIHQVIDTIASKVVLILGRFTPERKQVLDALRDELRCHNYSPVVFDFEKPASKDLTETVSTLAHLARFVIVDLTDPSSAPHEVASIIPHCIVPVQPLILGGKKEYSMFRDLRQRYHWVLPMYRYQDIPGLLSSIKEKVIRPAEQKVRELEKRKQEL